MKKVFLPQLPASSPCRFRAAIIPIVIAGSDKHGHIGVIQIGVGDKGVWLITFTLVVPLEIAQMNNELCIIGNPLDLKRESITLFPGVVGVRMSIKGDTFSTLL